MIERTNAGRIAYLVSRFPQVSETFVTREMQAVADASDLELRMYSLFPPLVPVIHPSAEPWVPVHRRARAFDGLQGLGYWLGRRPIRTLTSLWTIVRAYRGEPLQLRARAFVTAVLATGHARHMVSEGVDHIHAHFASYPATAAWMCWRLAGIPFSFTAHAHDIFVSQTFLSRKMADARFTIAISRFNREFLLGLPHDAEPRVEVVHCGIRPEDYQPPLDTEGKRLVVLCVASMRPYKGHEVLLEAFATDETSPLADAELRLIGSGELEPGLREQARRLGIEDRVRFLGSLPEDEVARQIREASVLVLASVVAADGTMDGIPVALMEAMASGVPVVSTRLSGIPELIQDRDTGLLADPGDSEDLRSVLSETLSDPSAAIQRATAGRALVLREFDLASCGREVARLLSESIPSGSGGTSLS
jgi:colanic acid/amylovoran biosynthesis glycosyltransferase